MTWVRLDDQMPDHPKVLAAGAEPMWLYTAALCWCARHLTDGRIPKGAVPRLAVVKSPDRCAERLVEVGLWDDDGDDFVVHDYLKFQPSKAQVEAQRDAARERQKKSRQKSRTRHGVTDAVSSRTPPHPTPPHPSNAEVNLDDDPSTEARSSSSAHDPQVDPRWPIFAQAGLVASRLKVPAPRDPDAYATATAWRIQREQGPHVDALIAARPDLDDAGLAYLLATEGVGPSLERAKPVDLSEPGWVPADEIEVRS